MIQTDALYKFKVSITTSYLSNALYISNFVSDFYILFTVHLSIILDNDQLDTHLLYFTMRLLLILYMFRALYAHHQVVELY